VAYGLRLRKMPEKEISEKVMRFLGMVGLDTLAKRPPSRLSGGQQQRVALARSLIVEPAVLLLDEPLSNLDALLREQMRVEIRRIQKSLGITAAYVTHDRVEAMSLSDRIIVMNRGKIVQIGSPHQVYRDPASAFVAGFIGKVAFFPGEVAGVEEHCTVKVRGKSFSLPRYSTELRTGDPALVMCRPESLTLLPPGEGILDGRVTTNVYLGHSIESFVATEMGEILVQVDNPDARQIFTEGEPVSVSFIPELTKALPPEE
jgi:iron(III) transport system ATP-binding protein